MKYSGILLILFTASLGLANEVKSPQGSRQEKAIAIKKRNFEAYQELLKQKKDGTQAQEESRLYKDESKKDSKIPNLKR